MEDITNIIEAKNLSKNYKIQDAKGGVINRLFSREYKIINAVNDVSFEVKRGEMIGFIGPNGAGKSTTIKMMSGILVPSSGEIKVLGNNPYQRRKKNAFKIGVIFGQRSQLWWDLPLVDTFKLLKSMYRISDDVYKKNMEIFLNELKINEFFHQPVRLLSLGQRMRGEIAAAMLHDPEILFLDEPTIGLDIVAKQQVREFVKSINCLREVTVILTTHDMKDIEDLCERIVLINHGNIVLDMPLDSVIDKFSKTIDIVITFSSPPLNLFALEGCNIIKNGEFKYTFRIEKSKISISELISHYIAGYEIGDISIQKTEVEEIMRQLF